VNSPVTLALTFEPGSSGKGALTAGLGDKVIWIDKIDPTRARSRERFARAVCDKCPSLDREELDRQLLGLADRATKRPDAVAGELDSELEQSRIVRPELFHTADVSGVTIPTVHVADGRLSGRWDIFLRWHADGRRKRIQLTDSILLPGGRRIWLHPVPSQVEPTMKSGWSAKAREAWLGGAAASAPDKVWQEITGLLGNFLDFQPDASETVTLLGLWVILTYVYPAWACVPYLYIGGPQESGKSTLFQVLSRMVYRPLESSNMTAACLFRTLHEFGGVLLLDEAERLRDGTPDAGELRSILLSGYKRGSPARRLEKAGERFSLASFNVYGPKALAAIRALPEQLASRCIRVNMFRAAADSPKPRRRLDERPERWVEVRDALHALALEYGQTWADLANRADVVPRSIGGRGYELWQPLLAIAAWLETRGVPRVLTLMQAHAACLVEANRDDSVPEEDEVLLRLLAAHVVADTARTLKAGALLLEAQKEEPATFDKWTPRKVASVLKKYGVGTKKGRGNVGRVYSDVTLSRLQRIERNYAFELELPAADMPTCTERTDQPS
jgi:hypothetical protein